MIGRFNGRVGVCTRGYTSGRFKGLFGYTQYRGDFFQVGSMVCFPRFVYSRSPEVNPC